MVDLDVSGDVSTEDLVAQLGVALQQVENLKQNQKGLIEENTKMRDVIQTQTQQQNNVPLIYSKMLAIKKELGYVGKDQKNSGQGYSFRGIDQFLNTLKPLLDKHGVGIIPEVLQNSEAKFITNEKTGRTQKNTSIVMKYSFFAEDGSMVSATVPAEGVDPGDKGTNKALSAALKYCLIQTFAVPTEDIAEADRDNPSFNDEPKAKKTAKSIPSNLKQKKSFSRASLKVASSQDNDLEL